MECTHNDCFTCPYEDCISDVEVEPDRKKRGRKKLPPEERLRRKHLRHQKYYETHKEIWRKKYQEKTEGKVKRRYRSKQLDLPLNKT